MCVVVVYRPTDHNPWVKYTHSFSVIKLLFNGCKGFQMVSGGSASINNTVGVSFPDRFLSWTCRELFQWLCNYNQ